MDPDSPLHTDLQVLKEKEGMDYILLNFSYKVSEEQHMQISVFQALAELFPAACRIISPLIHHLCGWFLLCSPEGEFSDLLPPRRTDLLRQFRSSQETREQSAFLFTFLLSFYPQTSYVLGGGALCMELLTKQVRPHCLWSLKEK